MAKKAKEQEPVMTQDERAQLVSYAIAMKDASAVMLDELFSEKTNFKRLDEQGSIVNTKGQYTQRLTVRLYGRQRRAEENRE